MPAVREALERMWLDRHSACRREPRPIRELIPQQPLHTFLVHRIVDRHASRNMQGIKRQACGIGVCSNAWNLAPTSIFILSGLQRLRERRAFGLRRAGIRERIELHRSFFRRVSLCREQPPFGSLDALLELFAAAGNGIKLDRPQDPCRARNTNEFWTSAV